MSTIDKIPCPDGVDLSVGKTTKNTIHITFIDNSSIVKLIIQYVRN